jgi:hypothetical protein
VGSCLPEDSLPQKLSDGPAPEPSILAVTE